MLYGEIEGYTWGGVYGVAMESRTKSKWTRHGNWVKVGDGNEMEHKTKTGVRWGSIKELDLGVLYCSLGKL